ncbi:alanine--tRNA ligase [Cardiobacterium hominis]
MKHNPPKSTAEIRRAFLDYFAEHGHKIVHSSSLVPGNDPTLLFTNAGMVQFKDIFTGSESRDYKRATTSQRCVRAGGKHNDLENVGYTARHHTFFEMLGNFSFGDYFKAEAIPFAWNLLTQVFGLPPEKLCVTVYHEDDEAFAIWRDKVGLPEDKIIRIGDKPGKAKYESDNFWAMGDTGPCGPCSEIFYDHGPDVWGGPPGSPEEDGDRFIEIWNIVFMQFERDANGTMKPLPRPSIDTGMGLERIAAVLQHVHSNYEIDIFRNLIAAAAEATGCDDLAQTSLKVIADHIRATVFLMVDGVLPGNEGRGYVLRRIMRRAIRHGYKLGQNQPFFYKLVAPLVKEMGEAYPEIVEAEEGITQAILREEERFAQTLESGLEVFNKVLNSMKFLKLESLLPLDGSGKALELHTADGKAFSANALPAAGRKQIIFRAPGEQPEIVDLQDVFEHDHSQQPDAEDAPYIAALEAYLDENIANSKLIIPGEYIFKLYDTYGFPYDLTADMARELGIELDSEGFEREMAAQRERAKAAGKFDAAQKLDVSGKTAFDGYEKESGVAQIMQLFREGAAITRLEAGMSGVVVLDRTPFYGESGGQVGDTGIIRTTSGVFRVEDTQKQGDAFLHIGRVESGEISVGETAQTEIDRARRAAIKRHHSATHLLHKALRSTLGTHVQQKGSLVNDSRTRFDFSHDKALTAAEIAQVEAMMNAQILGNAPVVIEQMSRDAAQKKGAMALFGEKYGDVVRVVSMGDNNFSIELCGGTHVGHLGEIGLAKVVSQGAVSAGVRRIEVVCGLAALAHLAHSDALLTESAALLKTDSEHLPERITALQHQLKTLEKDVQALKRQLAQGGDGGSAEVKEINGWKTIALQHDGLDNATLRDTADQLRDRHGADVVVIGSVDDDTARLIVSVGKTANGLHAGNIIRELAVHIGGKGGGRPDFAQAGGKNPAGLSAALAALAQVLPEKN